MWPHNFQMWCFFPPFSPTVWQSHRPFLDVGRSQAISLCRLEAKEPGPLRVGPLPQTQPPSEQLVVEVIRVNVGKLFAEPSSGSSQGICLYPPMLRPVCSELIKHDLQPDCICSSLFEQEKDCSTIAIRARQVTVHQTSSSTQAAADTSALPNQPGVS